MRTGLPPPSVRDANRQLLDTLFEGCGPYEHTRRCTIETMSNGDWSRAGVIETWVSRPASQQKIVHRFQKEWVATLCSTSPHVYPRHRWTGCRANDEVGAPLALLQVGLFLRFILLGCANVTTPFWEPTPLSRYNRKVGSNLLVIIGHGDQTEIRS